MHTGSWKAAALWATLGAGAAATVAPGFPVRVASELNVTWAGNNLSPAGELLPRQDTAEPPSQITTPIWTTGGKAVLMLVDSDVPRDDNSTRVQFLHWLAANVTRPSTDTQLLQLPDPDDDLVPYLQPNPPVGDIPHKYTLLLLEQPENFTVPSLWRGIMQNRIGWDTAAFANSTGLVNPLAANWMRVQNLTASGDGSPNATATATPSTTSSLSPTADPSTYPGAAAMLEPRAWPGLGTAVVAALMAFAM